MQRLISIIKKEFIQIFRDKNMLKIIFILPIIQMLLLSFAITNEAKHLKLKIVDLDQSHFSRELIEKFNHTDRFDLLEVSSDPLSVHSDIRKWKVTAGIIIPKGFAKDLINHNQPKIQLVFDAVDGNSAGIATGYITKILTDFSSNILLVKSSLNIDERMWYNLNQNTFQFMVPGIIAILVTVISMMLSSMALVKEKEIGTLEQLMVTPIKKWELLSGKLFPFLVITFFEFFMALTIAQVIFNIHIQGSYLYLAGLTLIYLFTTLGLGVNVSIISGTQQQAMFFSWFLLLFMILLSGLFMPIDNMPNIIKMLTYLNPMRYFVNIMREVVQKGNTLMFMLKDVIPMTIYGLIIFGISIIRFRKRA